MSELNKSFNDRTSLIVEVLNDQNLFTESNSADWFSSYVQFCSGGNFSERAEATRYCGKIIPLKGHKASNKLVTKNFDLKFEYKNGFLADSEALRRVSSLCRNHSQRVSKYSPSRRTISCNRIFMNIGLAGLSNRDS